MFTHEKYVDPLYQSDKWINVLFVVPGHSET